MIRLPTATNPIRINFTFCTWIYFFSLVTFHSPIFGEIETICNRYNMSAPGNNLFAKNIAYFLIFFDLHIKSKTLQVFPIVSAHSENRRKISFVTLLFTLGSFVSSADNVRSQWYRNNKQPPKKIEIEGVAHHQHSHTLTATSALDEVNKSKQQT